MCWKRDENQAKLLEDVLSGLRQPEAGAIKQLHTDLPRYLPTLHETGIVTSIVPTLARDGERPIFAVGMHVRNAAGGMDAHLGFAAMCGPDGDLALIAPLVPLHAPAVVIDWSRRVPYDAAPLTELEIETGEPPSAGVVPQRGMEGRMRSVVVGATASAKIGVIGTVNELDIDLAPANGIKRTDFHWFGSGWYAHRGGASYLLVHRVVYDRDDLCQAKKKDSPVVLPELRLVAHLDPKTGFTTDPNAVGTGYLAALPDNQPTAAMSDDKEFTLRAGPTAIRDHSAEAGPPAQWLYGIFESAEAARARVAGFKYKGATIFSTEPPAGRAAAKEPFVIPVKHVLGKTLDLGCTRY